LFVGPTFRTISRMLTHKFVAHPGGQHNGEPNTYAPINLA